MDAMDFRLVGAKRCDKLGIGHNMLLWDAGLGHEEYCIRAGGHTRYNALCESAEIVGKGADPRIFVGFTDKMVILKVAAGDFVNDGTDFTVAVLIRSEEKRVA